MTCVDGSTTSCAVACRRAAERVQEAGDARALTVSRRCTGRRYGTFEARELCDELAGRLPEDAEIIMVHCSLNDLEPMYTGGPRNLLDALVDLCGPERTLVMPAFFFGGPDQDPAPYYRERPVFDARRQPSQMGLLSELFRRREGVRRSLHPTASVSALGPRADELVAGHHLAKTTFGEGTPFAVMAEHRTAIVGIGTEYFRCLTQVHAAEDLLGERYPLALRATTVPVELKDVDGTTHDYDLRLDEHGMGRRLERLEQLLGSDELVQWRFHGVPLFVSPRPRDRGADRGGAARGTIYERHADRRQASGAMTFHHLGIATDSLENETRAYAALGYEPEGEGLPTRSRAFAGCSSPEAATPGAVGATPGQRYARSYPAPRSEVLPPRLRGPVARRIARRVAAGAGAGDPRSRQGGRLRLSACGLRAAPKHVDGRVDRRRTRLGPSSLSRKVATAAIRSVRMLRGASDGDEYDRARHAGVQEFDRGW